MLKKTLTTLAAGALLAASSVATAQSAAAPAAPEPAVETVGTAGENRLMGQDTATTLGILFGIFVIVLFIWGAGDDNEGPVSP